MTAALKVLSSMATRQLLVDLVAQYPRRDAVAIELEAVGGLDAAKRMRAGEAVDAIVLAANVIDQLTAEGKVLPGSRVDLVASRTYVAVKAGAVRPDISTGEALRQAVLDAPTLGYSTGPSGVYLTQLFERWGIAEQIAPRIVQPPSGTPVGQYIAEGRVALGFQQLSELVHLSGIDVVGPLPPEIQHVTVFAAGIAATSARAAETRDLLAFLASDAAAEAKRRNGLDPA